MFRDIGENILCPRIGIACSTMLVKFDFIVALI
jgi:hypothetical protein